jgi:hypothetical protein
MNWALSRKGTGIAWRWGINWVPESKCWGLMQSLGIGSLEVELWGAQERRHSRESLRNCRLQASSYTNLDLYSNNPLEECWGEEMNLKLLLQAKILIQDWGCPLTLGESRTHSEEKPSQIIEVKMIGANDEITEKE